jgi:hypothetical protein
MARRAGCPALGRPEYARPTGTEVILILNVEEAPLFDPDSLRFVETIRNRDPQGFAFNHNAAFAGLRSLFVFEPRCPFERGSLTPD